MSNGDFELEVRHVLYMALIGILWIILTWFASALFNEIYVEIPSGIDLFIKISWGVGGLLLAIAIGIFVETVL